MRHPMRCDASRCDRSRANLRGSMTWMSEPGPAAAAPPRANSAMPLGRSALARALHHRARVGVLLFTIVWAAGCIIPPSLSVDVQDAGIDSPPSITSVRSDLQELPEPGPVLFQANPNSSGQSLNLALLDTDINDTLYAQIYVDYTVQQPTPARSVCTPASTTGTATRTSTCPLAGLCLAADVGVDRLMEIVVFDREVLTVGSPTFKAIPAGGQSTTRTYILKCTS